MRILLDECVPRRLGGSLTGHSVATVQEQGWTGRKNGELLALMIEAGLEVLLTVDQGIYYQQNLQSATVAVIALSAKTNRLVDLLPLVPEVLTTLSNIAPGQIVIVRGQQ
jgi:hypothetical protein